MWIEKQCIKCDYIAYSQAAYYTHRRKCMMSSYKSHKGYEALKGLLDEKKQNKIKGVWEFAVDQEQVRDCVAKFKAEREVIKRKYIDLEEEAFKIGKLMKFLNSINEDDSQETALQETVPQETAQSLKRTASNEGVVQNKTARKDEEPKVAKLPEVVKSSWGFKL